MIRIYLPKYVYVVDFCKKLQREKLLREQGLTLRPTKRKAMATQMRKFYTSNTLS
jgi:hypothetical protein